MKKETRNNVIFLGLFLLISVPGAVRLFIKKLDPEAKPMYLPDPTPHVAAYNYPIGVATRVERVVPAEVADFTARVAALVPGERPADGVPILTEDRLAEVLTVDAAGRPMSLLVWRAAREVVVEGGEVEVLPPVTVPAEAFLALRDTGWPVPPQQATPVVVRSMPGGTVAVTIDGRQTTLTPRPLRVAAGGAGGV